MIKESFKNRLKTLAGLISEDEVKLRSNSGRSDLKTLGWYSEEYLLELGSDLLTSLDVKIQEENLTLKLSKTNTRISSNSLLIKIYINGEISGRVVEEEVDLVITVQFSNNSNTLCSVNYKQIINKFNLNSKHSKEDLDNFKNEIINNVLNSVKLSSQQNN